MPHAPRIRRIGADELERVRELALMIWPKCYRNIIPPDRIDGMLATLYSLDALDQEMIVDGHVFWLARVGSFDVGYASALQTGERLWLKKLYVMNDYRGLSIGRLFMEEALAAFPSTQQFALNVNHDNTPAINYYLKNGFMVEAKLAVKMGPYDFTDLVMVKDIEAQAKTA
jgi:diamine N-acetyltransferase